MSSLAYCPNGHSVPLTSGRVACPVCGAPLYSECPYGHSVWLTQDRCPACGSAQGRGVITASSVPQWTSISRLPAEKRSAAERFLQGGEQLLWAGEPDPKVRFTKADTFLVPFSILWAGFAVLWEIAASSSGGPVGFSLFGIPFVALGCYITFGRFIVKARRKRGTTYVLTDYRALVLGSGGHIAETQWRNAPKQISRHRDGRHVDVTFDTPPSSSLLAGSRATIYANSGMEFFTRGPMGVGFFDVEDGKALLAAMGQPLS